MPRTDEELAELAKEMGITEIIGMEVSKGVAVHGPANGTSWLMLKSLEQMEWEEFAKAKYTAEEKRAMLDKGHAIKNAKGEPSYPIKDQEDLEKAIRAVGRGGADHDAIRQHIMDRAKDLGLTKLIPENWNTDGSLAKSLYVKIDGRALSTPNKVADSLRMALTGLAKAAGDDMATCKTCDGSGKIREGNMGCPNCEGGKVAKGSKFAKAAMPQGTLVVGPDGTTQVPGSPEWEAQDGALLTAAAEMLADVLSKISEAADREMTEAQTCDPDDYEHAYSLGDACSALNYALSVVAALAFTEAQEGKEAGMAKGLLAKEGRVLSAATRDTITEARDRLIALLGEGDETGSTEPNADNGDEMIKEIEVDAQELQTMLDTAVANALTSDAFAKSLKKAARKAVAEEKASGPTTAPAAPATPLAKGEDDEGDTAPVGDAPVEGAPSGEASEPVAPAAAEEDSVIAKALADITANQAVLAEAVAKIAGTPQQGVPFTGDAANLLPGNPKEQLAKALAGARTAEERERISFDASAANLATLFSGGTPAQLK